MGVKMYKLNRVLVGGRLARLALTSDLKADDVEREQIPPQTAVKECLILFVDQRSLTRALLNDLVKHCAQILVVVPYCNAVEPEEVSCNHTECPHVIVTYADQNEIFADKTRKNIEIMRKHFADEAIIILYEAIGGEQMHEALTNGTRAFIRTTLDSPVSIETLQSHGADKFIPEAVVGEDRQVDVKDVKVEDTHIQHMRFTPREMEVLMLLREGKSNKVIARQLSVQEGTVKAHVQHIMAKMMVNNRTAVAVRAAQILD